MQREPTWLIWQVKLQVLVGLLIAILFAVDSIGMFLAALFGATIAVVVALLQYWHISRTNDSMSATQSMRILMRCSIERLVIASALFFLGIGVFTLSPLPLLVGFITTQIPVFVAGLKR